MSRKFEIRALLSCPDVELMTPVSTIVEAPDVPDMAEADKLLAPVAEEIISSSKNKSGGYRYELISLTVRLLWAF